MKPPSRRTVLISAAAAAVAAVSWKFYVSQEETFLAEDTCKIFDTYRPYAISIGQNYLRCTPQEAEPNTLASLMLTNGQKLPHDPDTLRHYIRERIRQDFTDGHLTDVEGWILSRTEARLCAMAVLTASPHAA